LINVAAINRRNMAREVSMGGKLNTTQFESKVTLGTLVGISRRDLKIGKATPEIKYLV
jgi:hypothetical protein